MRPIIDVRAALNSRSILRTLCVEYLRLAALHDGRSLVERGALVRNPAGGRSTSYALATMPA